MGALTRIRLKLDMEDFDVEQARRLRAWEDAQVNDWKLLEADPLKAQMEAATQLIAESPETGFAQLLIGANSGSLYGMNYVAWCYVTGTGVAKDLAQGEAWHRRAYEGGSERALLQYASSLMAAGRIGEAEEVYRAGWKRGFIPALYRLIRLGLRPTLSRDERLAWKPHLERAAAAGHPAARWLLAKGLLNGWFGVREIPRGMKRACGLLAATLRRDEDRPVVF